MKILIPRYYPVKRVSTSSSTIFNLFFFLDNTIFNLLKSSIDPYIRTYISEILFSIFIEVARYNKSMQRTNADVRASVRVRRVGYISASALNL